MIKKIAAKWQQFFAITCDFQFLVCRIPPLLQKMVKDYIEIISLLILMAIWGEIFSRRTSHKLTIFKNIFEWQILNLMYVSEWTKPPNWQFVQGRNELFLYTQSITVDFFRSKTKIGWFEFFSWKAFNWLKFTAKLKVVFYLH